jgi:hypothetical protein
VKLVNLTPHDIVLQAVDGSRTTIPASGTVARVSQTAGQPTFHEGVPVPVYIASVYGDVVGIPEESSDTFFIVSAVIGQRCHRRDLVMPGTGPTDNAIRESGQVVAVTRLVRTA